MACQENNLLHVLLVSFPFPGHINPLFRLAKCLASKGLFVTFSTTEYIGKKLEKANKLTRSGDNPSNDDESSSIINIGEGELRFEFFSDGWEIDDPARWKIHLLMSNLSTEGPKSLTHLITKLNTTEKNGGRPKISCIIYNPYVPWVLDVATEFNIPCAVLWVHSTATYTACYHYFHRLSSFPSLENPNLVTHIPGLPSIDSVELPSFLHPSNIDFVDSLLRVEIVKQFQNMSKCFCVLIDSFSELEPEQVKIMSKLLSPVSLRLVGPLFKAPVDHDLRVDVWSSATEESLKWLDAQPPGSVIYVSFGSIVSFNEGILEEMAYGVLNSGLKFLWVFRPQYNEGEKLAKLPDNVMKEAGNKGLVVPWCPQELVLAHPSVACTMTQCGWNTTMECLAAGVPVVGFPQFSDQVFNAKLAEQVYGVAVRVVRSERDLENWSRADVTRCIEEATRGPKAEKMKKNALKWKKAAEEAAAADGSSYRNIQEFVDEIKRVQFKLE